MFFLKKFYHWQIAYRKKGFDEFIPIPNPKFGWAADPFVIKYQGEIYLFAEIFLYKSERNGVIGYCKYKNNKFSEWKVTMDKHWHLSYPFVFIQEEKLYMCPESIQSEEVSIFELISFPDKWKKVETILCNGKFADSTFFQYCNENYMFTYKHKNSLIDGNLYLYKLKKNGGFSVKKISSDLESARPGGKIIYNRDKLIRVSQNSEKGYGTGLIFSEIDNVWPNYCEHIIKKVYPRDIRIMSKKKYIGIHTYNSCEDIEVIDLKYTQSSLQEYIAQKRVRKIFLNKY